MILFGEDGPDGLRRRIAGSVHAATLAETVIAGAGDICAALPAGRVLDARGTMLEVSRLVMERVLTLGVAWAVTGHAPFRARIVRELLAASAFEDWNRRHFLDTAEMVAAVAIGRDWTRPILSRGERETIDGAIAHLGLYRGIGSLRGGTPWATAGTNWTVVCGGGLLTAAALMRPDLPEACDELMERAGDALRLGLSRFDAAGGWPEGRTYGDYAARYAVLAIEALKATGLAERVPLDETGLLRHWRFQRALVGPSGLAFDAGDSLAAPGRSPVLGWFAAEEPEAAAWQWAAPGAPHPLDLVWYHPPASGGAAPEGREVFEAGFATLRRQQGGKAWYLAIRAGGNAANHAHLDLGSFVLDAGAERLVSDLGRADYDAPGYFDPARRFGHFPAQTRAHNVAFAAEQAVAATAAFVTDPADPFRIAVEIDDPTSPFHHLRGFALTEGGAVVADLLQPKAAGDVPLVWQVHTTLPVQAEGGNVRLGAFRLRLGGVPLSVEPVAAEAERYPAFRRLVARCTIPAEGQLIAATFSDDHGTPDPGPLAAWLTATAAKRWSSDG